MTFYACGTIKQRQTWTEVQGNKGKKKKNK